MTRGTAGPESPGTLCPFSGPRAGSYRRRGESIIEPMVIDMNEAQVRTLEQARQVLEGTQALEFGRAEELNEAWLALFRCVPARTG